jgi:hypothetical protein
MNTLHRCCFFIGLLLLVSCTKHNEEEDCDYAPFFCTTDEPTFSTVSVLLSPKYIDQSTEVAFYSGKVEDGTLIRTCKQSGASQDYSMSFGYISVSVKYTVPVDEHPVTITAIDGGELKFSSKEYCDATCYDVKTLTLDVRLDTTLLAGFRDSPR